jgi:hypothetical protein
VYDGSRLATLKNVAFISNELYVHDGEKQMAHLIVDLSSQRCYNASFTSIAHLGTFDKFVELGDDLEQDSHDKI